MLASVHQRQPDSSGKCPSAGFCSLRFGYHLSSVTSTGILGGTAKHALAAILLS